MDVDKNRVKDALLVMIRTLVKSAFQTGCFSVASEGLIHQVIENKGYKAGDIEALNTLYHAVQSGEIQREGRGNGAALSKQCYEITL